MIWEQNSRVIIMLTHLTEKGYVRIFIIYPKEFQFRLKKNTKSIPTRIILIVVVYF